MPRTPLAGLYLTGQDIVSAGVIGACVGGFLTAIFVGWVWRVDQAIDELEQHGARFAAAGLWSVLIKWVCPVAIGIIIVYTFITM